MCGVYMFFYNRMALAGGLVVTIDASSRINLKKKMKLNNNTLSLFLPCSVFTFTIERDLERNLKT